MGYKTLTTITAIVAVENHTKGVGNNNMAITSAKEEQTRPELTRLTVTEVDGSETPSINTQLSLDKMKCFRAWPG